jgi:hypothetical protein
VALGGGIDGVLTLDPKTRAEVEPWVDVPYGSSDIIDAGGLPLGPLAERLAPFSHDMVVLKGIANRSLNHPAGLWNYMRLRSTATRHMPTFLDICARYRDGQPLGVVTFGGLFDWHYSPNWFFNAPPVTRLYDAQWQGFESVESMSPDARRALAAALEHHAAEHGSGARKRSELATSRSYRDVAAYLRSSVNLPDFEPETWSLDGSDAGANYFGKAINGLQRTLWMFENDLAACSYVQMPDKAWDSHTSNLAGQTWSSGPGFHAVNKFLHGLQERSNEHGTLASQTLVILSSEIGRFPRLNSHEGKDHFPEVNMILLGPGLRRNENAPTVYGGTARRMEQVPVDIRSGKPTRSSRGHAMNIDDIGRTLLALNGIPAEPHGYQGRRLDFLLEKS